MTEVIIPAIVAVTVSILGLLVNLHIAKKTRYSARAQLRFSAGLKAAEECIRDLKQYASEAEKVRIACWQIWLSCDDVRRRGLSDDVAVRLTERISQLREQNNRFFALWAQVKPDIRGGELLSLRKLRHESRTQLQALLGATDRILDAHSHPESETLSEASIQDIQDNLRQILNTLDRIFSDINERRNKIIFTLVTGSD